MNKQDQLEELLVDWGMQRQQGKELTAEELCKDSPELVPELSNLISDIKATDWLEEDDDSDDDFLHLPDFSTISVHADETHLPDCKLSIEEFCQRLVQSDLMNDEQVGQLKQQLAADTARSFAQQLVERKKLTRFQATVLLEGDDIPLVLDRYVVLDEIGKGGMGAVYKALHQQMDRVVALKILPKDVVDSIEKVKRFQREVKAAAKLEHPNIVTTHDASEDKGYHFLVMSLVNGCDLAVLVRKQGPLSVAKAVNYIKQAARGLEHAHNLGITHRDIKPGNLLLDKKGVVKLLDMGLARIEAPESNGDNTVSIELTEAGTVMGTVAYLPPEQALDTRYADARSDIYSLGCTLYFLLTGKAVYNEDTMIKIIMAHREQDIPSLCEQCTDVSSELDAVYQRMVAKNPDDRFQSMADVMDALAVLDIEDEEDDATVQLDVGSKATQETVTFLETSRDVIAAKPASQSTKRRWGLIAAGLLGIVGLVWLAVIIVNLKTPAGTIVLEIDDPNAIGAVVTVDGKTITIDQKGQMPIEVTADEKEHLLKVTKGGFETFTEKFSLGAGGKKNVRVRLEKSVAADRVWTDREVAEWAIGIGGAVWKDGGVGWKIEQIEDLDSKFKLENLSLGKTKVSDNDMRRLCGLKNLRFLSLNYTDITHKALIHLSQVDGIEGLTLNRASVTDAGLKALNNFPSLKKLGMTGTRLSEVGFEHIGRIETLQELHLQHTGMTDKGLWHLRGLKNLTILGISDNGITDTGLEHLKPLNNLESLVVSGRISDTGLEHLKSLKNLEKLNVKRTKVTPKGIADLQKTLPNCKIESDLSTTPMTDREVAEWVIGIGGSIMTKPGAHFRQGDELPMTISQIQAINLPHNGFNDDELSRLIAVKSLGRLRVGKMKTTLTAKKAGLTGAGLAHLAKLTDLHELGIDSARNITDDDFAMLRNLIKLKRVDLGQGNKEVSISDAGIASLSDLPELYGLSVNNGTITGVGLRNFNSLNELDLSSNPLNIEGIRTIGTFEEMTILTANYTPLNDAGLLQLKNLTNLTNLSIGKTKITDVGVKHLAVMTKLQELNIGDNRITDSSLMAINNLRELTSLSLHRTEVSDNGLELLKVLTKLETLNLRETKVTAEGIAALQKALPNCKIDSDFSTAPMTDREVAEWVLGAGGYVETDKEKFKAVDSLPEVDFRISRITLDYRQVDAKGLEKLNALTNLSWLALNQTRISDADLEHIKGLTNLTHLGLNKTKVSDVGLTHLMGLRKLIALSLASTRITDASLTHIGKLETLRSLHLQETLVGDSGIEQLKGLKLLSQLSLHDTVITDSALKAIRSFQNLSLLRLGETAISDDGLEHLTVLKSLKTLAMPNTMVGDIGLKHLKALKILHFG